MNKSEDLKTLHRAIGLCENIIQALKEGDSTLANTIADERHALIQSISFEALLQQHPDISALAIAQFEKTNARLIKTSIEIKDAVADEIKKVKKSFSGAKAYTETSKYSS